MMDLLGMDILQRILKKAPDISYKKSNMFYIPAILDRNNTLHV